MTNATFRFYARLNAFLAVERRGQAFRCSCAELATTKHMIEALGVPHTEVALVLVNGAPADRQPLKHTVILQPGGSAQFDLTADEPGDWAFHCHLLYHMHAGMFQIVTVANPDGSEA